LSLLTPRLAAPGAGLTHTTAAATRRSFAAAGVALRDAQSQVRACDGGQARATRSAQAGCGVVPRTLVPGGATAARAAVRRKPRPAKRPPRFPAWSRRELEGAYTAALDARDGGRAAESRMTERARVDYGLVYTVMRLAPSFGRTRGRLRGAAGYQMEWPACRTRASLADARAAEAAARRAWGASELSMEALLLDYQRMRRCTAEVEAQRVLLERARRRDAVARAGGARVMDERRRETVAAEVAQVAASLAAGLVRAQGMLDQFYWGVWGSARRIKASAREVDVLTAAVCDAELGDWYEDLPGGSNWLEAAAAAMRDGEQLGGSGEGGHGHDGVGSAAAHEGAGGGDSDGGGHVDALAADAGRQAADGGRADCGWRGSAGEEAWGLQTRSEEAGLQAVHQQQGDELKVGDVEGAADCVCWPVRTRLWFAWAHRRRRRLQDACSTPRAANARGKRGDDGAGQEEEG
jgi:hypothetical protein